ncbi:SusC/RagA family TonB-linked outer membrane protein [Elizabethkingia anophelis]|uniref:SusC/RagA family TonB-linked outer membrane protein n=1 Tax=Elizabethkingia anophelis TaxID=1117645 RepID=UPI00293C6139|nr:SusC/RagA family TonB-linked outer membrane protein [Elizabethkingia anophelis]
MKNCLKLLSAGVVFFAGQDLLIAQQRKDTVKTKEIEEVVMVGFGQKKSVKEVTGAVSTMKADKIEKVPVASVDKMMMGRVSGVQTGSASGQPGGATNVRVRGITSVNGGVSPIYIVDGVRISSGDLTALNTTANILANLNSDDIESLTVLKDAVSTSLYGADSGAGVILITTKSGKSGKPRFSFHKNFGINKIAFKLPGTLNKEQWLDLASQIVTNTYSNDFPTKEDAYKAITDPNIDVLRKAAYMGYNTDWNKELSRNSAVQEDLNFSASGGTDKFKYYSSFNYFTQESVYKASDFKRLTASTKLEYKATERLNITSDFNFSNGVINTVANGGAFSNPLIAQYFNLPIDPVRNPDGSWYLGIDNQLPSGNFNAAALQDMNYNRANTTRIFANLGVNYKIIPNLSYRFVFAPEYIVIEEDQYLSPLHGDGYSYKGQLSANTRRFFNFNIQNILEYNFKVGTNHNFVARLIQEAYKTNGRNINAVGSVVALQRFQTLDNFIKPNSVGGTKSVTSRAGYAAQINYNYKQIFNLDASYRRDALSNFMPGKKAGNFYSVGASVDVAEIFLKDSNTFSAIKLRSSYGKLGNTITSTPYATYSFGLNYNDNAGAVYAGVYNPDLKWETVKPFNIGLDVGLLKDRIKVTAEYFNKKTEDLVFSVPLSNSHGLGSYDRNIGHLVNKGMEFSVDATILKAKSNDDLGLNFDANLSTLDNKITSLYGGKDIINGLSIMREGEIVGSFFMRKWAGVDPANGDPLWYINGVDGATTNDWNQAKRAVQGSPFAKIFGGAGLNVSYKGFSLNARLTYSFGAKVFDNWAFYTLSDGAYTLYYPGYASQLDYWTPQNPNATNPKPYDGGVNANQASTRFLYKADYLRLSNVRLGYTFRGDFIKGAPINSFTVYIMGNNIWTKAFDNNLAFDPESAISALTNLNLPVLKSYVIGFTLDF